MSCGTQPWWSRSRRARYCSRLHARWVNLARRRAEEHARRTRLPRASTRMNRTAHGCESKSGGFGGASTGRRERDQAGLALAPRRRREVVVLAPPVEEQHAAVLAFLADGEAWSSSALAMRLAPAARTCSGRSRSLRQARCSRSVAGEHVVGCPARAFRQSCYSRSSRVTRTCSVLSESEHACARMEP